MPRSLPTPQAHEAIRSFFDGWHLYQTVIQHNYMAHREIHEALRRVLIDNLPVEATLLDLGCGDASCIATTVQGTPVRHVIGVDLSSDALALAAQNFAQVSVPSELVQADLLGYLAQPSTKPVDVIVCGFAVHHLSTAEKETFFQRARRLLDAGSLLLMYDTYRSPEESRAEYLARYLAYARTNWCALSSAQHDQIAEHVLGHDFPETSGILFRLAETHGFATKQALLFSDGSHGLWCFRAA